MISERSLVAAALNLKMQDYRDGLFDFLTGRLPGAYLFHLVLKPSQFYQKLQREISQRVIQKAKRRIELRAQRKVPAISEKVTNYLYSEKLLLKGIDAIENSILDNWTGLAYQAETIIPLYYPSGITSLVKNVLLFSVTCIRNEPDDSELKKSAISKTSRFISGRIPLIYRSGSRKVIQEFVTDFFSRSDNRNELIRKKFAGRVSQTLKPDLEKAVESVVHELIPLIAETVEVTTRDTASSAMEWVGYQLSSLVSSGLCAVIGTKLLWADDNVSALTVTGTVVIANIGIIASQALLASSQKVEPERVSQMYQEEYGNRLKNFLVQDLAKFHNKWVPRDQVLSKADFIDLIPDETIEKGIDLIVRQVLAEIKIV